MTSTDPAFDRRGPAPDARNTYAYSTDRLTVELPTAEDAEELYALVGGADRDEVTATLIWDGPDSLAETEDWIERCRTETYEDWGFHWVIRDTTGAISGRAGRPLGAIGTRPKGMPGRADVGYWLGRPYWGRGVMTEALIGLLQLGFDDLGYAKIEADVYLSNERGIRLVERVGMEREGVVRRAVRKRGVWVDEAIYGILWGDNS